MVLPKPARLIAAIIFIAPAHFVALGRPIDEAAKTVKVVAIDSTADSKALISVLAADNTQAGRIAADVLAERIQKTCIVGFAVQVD